MSEVLCLGISHKTAPVALRERLAMPDAEAQRLLRGTVAGPAVEEAVVISTCNRTEVYLTVTDTVAAETAVLGALASRAGIRPTELAEVIYSPRNCDAARQLYRVTAGLESMIVGEAEIQGQVKRAYELALVEGATGPILNRMFRGALAALLSFMVVLLIFELSIATGSLRLARRLEIRLRMAFLHKIPRLGDRYFRSRPISDMAERGHAIHRLRLLPDLGRQRKLNRVLLLHAPIRTEHDRRGRGVRIDSGLFNRREVR